MPWSRTSPMDQRTQFIADYLRESLSTTELCVLYGVSRKTGYKWIDRYLRCGPAGLEEHSRAPRNSPNQTPEDIVAAIIEARRRHPSWGGKKLLALLAKRHPPTSLPGQTDERDPRAQRCLERRLQRAVQNTGWPLLLSAHRDRQLKSLSSGLPGIGFHDRTGGQARVHPLVQRVWAPQANPHG